MPFPLLSLEFLDLPICLILETILICGFFATPQASKQNSISKAIAFGLIVLCGFLLNKSFYGLYKPEPMISFLAMATAMRFLYPVSENDKISRALMLVWIASFSLLKSDISYFFYMIYGISFIFLTLNSPLGERIHPLKILKIQKGSGFEVISVLSIVIILFIFFPRYNQFFPKRNSINRGKIGYSKTVDNSQILNLQKSSQIAFTAETLQKLPQEKLYWRGRVHQRTDGFNWSKGISRPLANKVEAKSLINYVIKYEQDMGSDLILLETPTGITKSSSGYYRDITTNTYRLYNSQRKVSINATSSLKGSSVVKNRQKNKQLYLQLPKFIPASLKDLKGKINQATKNSGDLADILESFRAYLISQKFSYSLSPGDVTTLTKFLEKKVGYCSHYASLLGILLRSFGHPTRLVTGFQGGTYNEIGGFYTIRSNDAHAWVEVLEANQWKRIDPTSFIDPSRINLGGELYFSNTAQERSSLLNRRDQSAFLKIQKYWAFMNYKISLFIEGYDQSEQRKLSKKFKLSKELFYGIGLSLVIIFLLFYLFRLKSKPKKENKIDRLFDRFITSLNKNGTQISNTDSLKEIKEKIEKNKKLSNQLNEIVDAYESAKYASESQETFIAKVKNKKISPLK